MSFLCKIFGHKMYNIVWDNLTADFTVLCLRCEKNWDSK
jgi:hypothetical protein